MDAVNPFLDSVVVITSVDLPVRPLRKDAERNRRRILDAARELFAERGLGVTLNDIAHHAGVGVGTVYRRFPDKDELIEGLFEERFAELESLAERALADPDPWHGLTGFLQGSSELQCADRGLKELVCGSQGLHRIARIRARLLPMGEELVRRAQQNGSLRADISPRDLPILQVMTGAVIDASREVDPELWRRYVGILIRGMSGRPDEEPALAGEPLEVEDVDRVMSAHKSAPR